MADKTGIEEAKRAAFVAELASLPRPANSETAVEALVGIILRARQIEGVASSDRFWRGLEQRERDGAALIRLTRLMLRGVRAGFHHIEPDLAALLKELDP